MDDAAGNPSDDRPTKKDQILALYVSGMQDVEDLAQMTGAEPSYVGSVLREKGLETDYFDLYTSTSHPMNVYSKFFAGKLGFRDLEAARASVALIDRVYRQFAVARDRAGQHHALPRDPFDGCSASKGKPAETILAINPDPALAG